MYNIGILGKQGIYYRYIRVIRDTLEIYERYIRDILEVYWIYIGDILEIY